jgi:hypothetical protein
MNKVGNSHARGGVTVESRQQLREQELDGIRTAWAEGKASEVAGPYDVQAIIRQARAKTEKPSRSARD